MGKKGLFSKMMLAYILIISIAFVILASFLSYWFEGYYNQQRKAQLDSQAEFIANASISYMYNQITTQQITDILKSISTYSQSDILLSDTYGYMYASSSEEFQELIGTQIVTDELPELRLGKSFEKKQQFGSTNSEELHIYGVPIFFKDVFKGTIIMTTPLSFIQEPLTRVYEIIWISAMIAIIISIIVLYYFSQRIIIKPLSKINYVAGKISNGEVDKRVDINSNDEIGELADAFNTMADSLERVELNRRSFIANVSHELRSPITSVKGFISGILDGIIPKSKERYYLAIVYEEIERLTRLINDLLDLSTIEEGKFKLHLMENDLAEIIKASVIKFETTIKARKLKMDVWLEGDVKVMVDRDRIYQVFTNLIDNAIKYSNDEGYIEIKTKSKGQKVFVYIYNDGALIPEEEIKNIWERFYKSDKSRTVKVSTGLGLSIVRKIIIEHDESIWVENGKEKGVTFSFTLKKV
ncbi:sensor histidine kinase [Clostridium grantii]|uniref:histidine kinase n=1 Tax=Clostridium grantii DSM 8605 TaxID=1121316 RepID=A0A1M5X8Z6_9CLOT|nr:HAMP domain-containing sensor histidine kinase [Clostridium grantii]SHH96269.1 Signal transduction histidine kinase [Clostridium grantii DSM 8605]